MYFDTFDIVSAHYAFCTENYNGQTDPLYARACKITSKLNFNPGPCWRGYDSLTENGQEIYNNLVEKNNAA